MLKKILIGIAVLVALLVVGAIAALSLVDVDHYKPQIEQAVHDKLGRTLNVDGRLSLSLFPTIAVALPHTTLSEHGSDDVFLSLERARVSLAVLPLLRGRVEAGTISLYGLRATVVHRADGTNNLEDLTGGKPAPKAGETAQPGAGGGAPPAFEIGGIDLVDAQVVYRDEQAHNTVTLSKLNLKTGHIGTRATTPVDFSASVAATEPPTAMDLSLKATVEIDLPGKSFGADGLEAHVRGHSGPNQIDVALTAPKVAVQPEHLAGELVKLVASVSGGQQARVELALENLTGTGEKLSIGKITGEVDLESSALPQKSLKVKLDGSLNADTRAQHLAAKLAAHFDDTNASTRVDVHGFSAPHIAFEVDIDRLNLDRYLPASAPGTGAPAAAAPGPAQAAGAGKADADPKVDLSALKPLNLAGEARIGSLQVHNAKASKIKVGVHAAGGHLDVAPVTATLYEGSLNGSSKIDADGNRVAVNASLDGISIEPLLKDLMGKDILEGHGGVKINVTTAGPTVGAMRRALGGTASLALHDGAVHGIDIAGTLRNFKTALAGGSPPAQSANAAQKTDFSELTASFSIKNGVATNNDLQAKSPLLRVTGAGTIDVGASVLDYTVQAAVVGTLAGQGGGDLSSLHGVTVPVHLTGPFTALSYRLDWGSVARQAAKGQAIEKLKGLLGGKSSQGSQSPATNPADALKGLLGR